MVRLDEYKHLTEHKAIEPLGCPGRVWIPLIQHLGKPCTPLVKVGDRVLTGQKIASAEANVYAPIHASVSGVISGIVDWPHPVLGRSKAVVIDSDGKDEQAYASAKPATEQEIAKLTPQRIRDMVLDAGIVGLGGAGFPTHIKLNPQKPVQDLIINSAECEPFLTSDYRLVFERCEAIIKGIAIVARCLGVKRAVVAIEDNKPQAIEKLRAHSSQCAVCSVGVKVLKTEYPQGGERQLIKKVLGKEVPRGKLPFDVGVVVQNVATVYAIYEAIYHAKPLFERVVTVTGSCLASPKNLLVRIGTPIKDLIASCGPVHGEPAKIIIGGPMMGIAQYTDEVPVVKTTGGIVLLDSTEALQQQELVCIRCGACVRACPAGLMPCMINLASLKEMWPQAKLYGAFDCIECGLCNYVCPANRALVQSIKRAKLEINK